MQDKIQTSKKPRITAQVTTQLSVFVIVVCVNSITPAQIAGKSQRTPYLEVRGVFFQHLFNSLILPNLGLKEIFHTKSIVNTSRSER